MTHIKVPAVQAKLRKAEQDFRHVIILASAGWGKTAAVTHYYRNRSVLWLSGSDGSLNQMPPQEKIRQGIVVIDNLSWLTDPDSENYILTLLKSVERQVVLIGRGHFPGWLTHAALDLNLIRIQEGDFLFTPPLMT